MFMIEMCDKVWVTLGHIVDEPPAIGSGKAPTGRKAVRG